MVDFKLPELGEGIEEADVLKILVSEGDTVEVGQSLVEIETEKATVEVPAESAGTITQIYVQEGATIRVGDPILTIQAGAPAERADSEPADSPPEKQIPPEEAPPETEGEERQSAAAEPAEAPAADEPPAAAQPDDRRPPVPAQAVLTETPAPGDTPVFASPSLRKFAREIGVDLAAIAGTGPGGRITEDDIKRASRTKQAEPSASTIITAAADFRTLPDFSQWGTVQREHLSRLRRTVSRNMAQSWTEIPHVHLHHHADITAMEELRQKYKDRAKAAGGNLTISVMMLKVVASALRAHPKVNSSYDHDSQELILKDYVHIGVAVDTDRGLVVPKIENVDQKNIVDLSVELNGIAERARTNDLTLEEMRGSTFTVTNLGSLGTGHFAPIINWPEVAVLGLGRAQRTAVWEDEPGGFTPRLIMPLSLGHDHRVLDGADGARFMTWIVDAIRDPLIMALEG